MVKKRKQFSERREPEWVRVRRWSELEKGDIVKVDCGDVGEPEWYIGTVVAVMKNKVGIRYSPPGALFADWDQLNPANEEIYKRVEPEQHE